jgi:hypothetical protein
MLARAAELNRATGLAVPLVQADAGALPLRDASVDLACSAFGGLPFVADAGAVLAEVARVLRPGGRFVASVNHPMRWPMPDSPDPADLRVTSSYFDRDPYVETDGEGRTVYVEHHRTLGDWVRAVVGAGLVLTDLLEPEWTPGRTEVWGQWSPERGALVPGTSSSSARSPHARDHRRVAALVGVSDSHPPMLIAQAGHQTSPSRQSQVSPPSRSRVADPGRTQIAPSSLGVGTTPDGVRAETGPRHSCQPQAR